MKIQKTVPYNAELVQGKEEIHSRSEAQSSVAGDSDGPFWGIHEE